ncbi:hypothetical protein D3C81_1291720 [compost metagenome]
MLRVFGFTCRYADDFNTAKRKHHHRERSDQTAHAIGHEAAVAPEVADVGRLAGGRADAEPHDAETTQDHRDDGGDLEQRQPELHFTEDFDVAQVQAANDGNDTQHPDPAGNLRKPEAHVDTECSDVGHADDDHFECVGPTEDEARHRPQVGAGVLAERAGHRVVHRHLTEGAHDHEHRRATDQVSEQYRRTGHLNGRGRSIKQPGADCRPQRHEANMSGREPAFQTFFWLLHFSSLIIVIRRKIESLASQLLQVQRNPCGSGLAREGAITG